MVKGYLVVKSLDHQMHCYPHPDPTMGGMRDLIVPSAGELTADPEWAEVACFIQSANRGEIAFQRSATPSAYAPLQEPEELRLDDPVLQQVARTILEMPWSEIGARIVMLEQGRGRNSRVNTRYLVGTHLRFLQHLLWHEQHKAEPRQQVVDLLGARIEEIKQL